LIGELKKKEEKKKKGGGFANLPQEPWEGTVICHRGDAFLGGKTLLLMVIRERNELSLKLHKRRSGRERKKSEKVAMIRRGDGLLVTLREIQH